MSLVLADASPSEAVVDGADLLPFQREITKELLARDGFCVLAEGLGASAVIAALVAVAPSASASARAVSSPHSCSHAHAAARVSPRARHLAIASLSSRARPASPLASPRRPIAIASPTDGARAFESRRRAGRPTARASDFLTSFAPRGVVYRDARTPSGPSVRASERSAITFYRRRACAITGLNAR